MGATVFRLRDLAERVGGVVRGDGARPIRGLASLTEAGPDELSFLANPRYRAAARASRAGALLVRRDSGLEGRDLLEVADPQLALATLLELFHPPRVSPPLVSPDARLGQGVRLGVDVTIGPFAVIGDDVELGARVVVGAGSAIGDGSSVGEGTVLAPRVVLYPGTRVGARCILHAGVVLGGDGFGFAAERGRHRKVPQVGHVVVEDDVEIGANTTVDRGALGATRIGRGTKIDNLVMVAHGAELGEDCLLVAQAGVAGSARLGGGTIVAGQAGVAGHLVLGAGTRVAAKSAVFDDVAPGTFVAGIPAVPHLKWKRAQAALARLPELRRELGRLKARVAELERSATATDEGNGT